MAAQMHCQPHNPAQAWMAGMSSFSSIAVFLRHTVVPVCLSVFLLGVALLGLLSLAAILLCLVLIIMLPRQGVRPRMDG